MCYIFVISYCKFVEKNKEWLAHGADGKARILRDGR